MFIHNCLLVSRDTLSAVQEHSPSASVPKVDELFRFTQWIVQCINRNRPFEKKADYHPAAFFALSPELSQKYVNTPRKKSEVRDAYLATITGFYDLAVTRYLRSMFGVNAYKDKSFFDLLPGTKEYMEFVQELGEHVQEQFHLLYLNCVDRLSFRIANLVFKSVERLTVESDENTMIEFPSAKGMYMIYGYLS